MVEIVNRMDNRVDVYGVVGTYHANMLKQYVERKNVTSHCLLSAEANVTVDEETDTEEFGIRIACSRQQKSHNHIKTSVYLTR